MHDKFEREVQQKMEELHLTPSAPVWEKIEIEIRPEKKKRRAIFWFLLAAVLLAGSIVWWTSHESVSLKDTPVAEEVKPANSTSSVTDSNRFNNKSAEIISSEKLSNNNTKAQQINVTKGASNTEKNSFTNLKKRVSTNNTTKRKPASTSLQIVSKPDNALTRNIPDDSKETSSTTQKDQQVTSPKSESPVITELKPNVTNDSPKPVTTDSVEKKPVTAEEPSLALDSTLKKKVAASKKWKSQVLLNFGGNSFASGLLSFEKSLAQADASFNNSGGSASGGSGIGSGGPSIPNTFSSTPIKEGLSFSLGFGWAKELSDRWEFAAGVQYTVHTTTQRVGNKVTLDSATLQYSTSRVAVDEYYTNNNTRTYTNRFHVIEVPVTISFRLAVKTPLFILAGVSYGRLISTNALEFNNVANVYYANPKIVNRDFVPVQLALQYRFTTKKGLELLIGPALQYDLQTLYKGNLFTPSHLLFAGVKTALRF